MAESGIGSVAKNSLVPFPGWSKKVKQFLVDIQRNRHMMNVLPANWYRTRVCNRPPDPIELPDDEIKAYTLQDILDDDELSLLKARKAQSKIRKANRRGE